MGSRTLLLVLGLNFSLLGNLEARYCPWGYTAKGSQQCGDMDECKEWDSNPPCGSNAACYNTQGSFYCQCLPGFRSTTTVQFTALTGECKDLDECQGKVQLCTSNTICLNTIGSFNCQCKPGFKFSAYAGHCEDLDECQETPQVCGSNTSCLNTFGSYHCQCQPGFRFSNHTLMD
ncbi:adhesion G protein-coupled receptor E2-like [Oncorhynchus kisutch]|uniref:adhesion G protein-coupled receptor E2-like n=2 Tax=Oncorhynchus kisutch TaxID=8019 RepID=UPI0012DCB788|nr:adhesion G protein-coupled receptor E2-like [Oncorhynchus kisutch]XP_031674102.1 adhesion G protein-coupled receptor E2-like [Oncorhynchus kisutch]